MQRGAFQGVCSVDERSVYVFGVERDGLHENDACDGVCEHFSRAYNPFQSIPKRGKDGYNLGGFEQDSSEYVVYDLVSVLSERDGEPFQRLEDPSPVRDFFPRRDGCLLYTSPSPRDQRGSRMPSSA